MEYVYMLACADDTLYTGWTNNLTARLAAHNSGRGAKYTKGRTPVRLVFSEVFPSRSEALGYEAAIKKLGKVQKQQLIAGQNLETEEYLTVLDAQGRDCGRRPRCIVHQQGLRHGIIHLWVFTEQEGISGLWLQRRALDRPLYPGRYDLAATGHIAAGETPLHAVLREAQEECGLKLTASELMMLPQTFHQTYSRPDGGLDDEISYIFVYRQKEPIAFLPNAEVMEMRWVSCEAFARAVEQDRALVFPDGTTHRREELCCRADEWRAVCELLRQME
ncbi:MAG: GIY-YIG nuclease family protein [Butyricicoccus pullicaecorum]|nr:GIY-YIG nuclease family protein [Butyricicoccus pullicaecorum]